MTARGCLQYLLYLAAWVFLFVTTLGLLATIVSRRLMGQASGEGYGAYISLFGFLVIMPIGLLVSCLVFAMCRRLWVFLALAILAAVGTALGPVILSAGR